MYPFNSISILDIDKTLIISDPANRDRDIINPVILAVLKACHINRLFLFSTMAFSGIAAECKQILSNGFTSISRKALLEELERQGFEVLGLITPYDPIYNQGLGKTYTDILAPFYAYTSEKEITKKKKNARV